MQEYCRSVPKKTCRLNFNKTEDSPNLVPIVQKYCIVKTNGTIAETDEDTTTVQSEGLETTTMAEDVTNDQDFSEDNEDNKIVREKQSRKIEDGSNNLELNHLDSPESHFSPTSVPTLPEYETTKIDDFTIPKMLTTTTLPPDEDPSLGSEIASITDMVRRLVDEEQIIVEERMTLGGEYTYTTRELPEDLMTTTTEITYPTTTTSTTTTTMTTAAITTTTTSIPTTTTTTSTSTTTSSTASNRRTTSKTSLRFKYPRSRHHFNIVRTIPSLLFKPKFNKESQK